MLNKIRSLIQEDLKKEQYKITEFNGELQILSVYKSYVDIENYKVIRENEEGLEFFRVNRNKETLILRSEDADFVISCVIMLCNDGFSEFYSNKEVECLRDKLRVFANNNQLDKAEELIKDSMEKNFFVVNNENPYKISLILNDNKANVKYQNSYIVKDVKSDQGYVVFFNYIHELMLFEKLFMKLSGKYNIQDRYNELAQVFIFGHLL